MAFDNIKVENIHDTEANRKALLDIAQLAAAYDGSFDWSDVFEDLDDMFVDKEPSWIADRIYFGDYDPNADWYRFDAYGNIDSASDNDLINQAWDEREDIIDWLHDESEGSFDNVSDYANRIQLTDAD